jgi:outer membrane lipoprotein-sorting protein
MRSAIFSFVILVLPVRGAETLPEILHRMDADAITFKGVTADMKRIDYTAAIKAETVEQAVMTLIRKKGIPQALLDFSAPDKKTYAFHDKELQEYMPKVNTVNVYDVGKYSKLVNELVSLGFGSSGKDLEKTYSIALIGLETVKTADSDVKATKLELVPRSAEGLKRWKKIEFWIPEGKSYAVKLKIYQDHDDTDTAIYSNVQINPATLSEKSVELKLPKDAKKVFINKQ